MSLNKIQAIQNFEFKFPNLKVLDFRGASQLLRVECAIHGEQVVSSYSNAMRSVTGCPQCGKELRVGKLSQRMKSKHARVRGTSSASIQNLVDQTFPDSYFEVITYTSSVEPITIKCPKHGVQTVSRYANFIKSKHGCPECGKSSRTTPTAIPVRILDTSTSEVLSFSTVSDAAKHIGTRRSNIDNRLFGRVGAEVLISGRYKVLL